MFAFIGVLMLLWLTGFIAYWFKKNREGLRRNVKAFLMMYTVAGLLVAAGLLTPPVLEDEIERTHIYQRFELEVLNTRTTNGECLVWESDTEEFDWINCDQG